MTTSRPRRGRDVEREFFSGCSALCAQPLGWQGLVKTPFSVPEPAKTNEPWTARLPVGQDALRRLSFWPLTDHFLPILALKLVTEPWPLVIDGTLMNALVPYLPPVFFTETGPVPTRASPQELFACAVSVLSSSPFLQVGRPLVKSSPALSKSSETVFTAGGCVPSLFLILPSSLRVSPAFSFFGKAVGEKLPSKVASMSPSLMVMPAA